MGLIIWIVILTLVSDIFDGGLQATVIVKPKRAPLAIGVAGLLLLVGGLVAPLQSRDK